MRPRTQRTGSHGFLPEAVVPGPLLPAMHLCETLSNAARRKPGSTLFPCPLCSPSEKGWTCIAGTRARHPGGGQPVEPTHPAGLWALVTWQGGGPTTCTFTWHRGTGSSLPRHSSSGDGTRRADSQQAVTRGLGCASAWTLSSEWNACSFVDEDPQLPHTPSFL